MTVTQLVIASHNVRSLGQGIQGVRKRCDLRDFYTRAEPQPQILLLQEHHYSSEDCMELTDQLQFKGGLSLWNNATFSPDGGRFSGGTGISASKLFADKIVDCGVLVEARAQFATFKINGMMIGVINIYAPNCTGQRAVFWNKLADARLPASEWIVAGDFNMTELGEDRSQGSNLRNMGPRELTAWTRFVLNLGISDVFHSPQYKRLGSKQFTYFRQRPYPMWSRIDRFYTTPDLNLKGGRHGIWPMLSHLSDHAAVFLVIPFSSEKRIKRAPFNWALIDDEKAHIRFVSAWRDALSHKGEYSMSQCLVTALEQIRRVSQNITSDRKRAARLTHQSQFEQIIAAEEALDRD